MIFTKIEPSWTRSRFLVLVEDLVQDLVQDQDRDISFRKIMEFELKRVHWLRIISITPLDPKRDIKMRNL